ncbi:hypothetical protein [Streptomyces cadmiisoli]|uniref:hypothetical protein n=1 Tax=Streptomyces cadmiisoli TaxID=2184053 RepID=UPI003658204D
MTSSHRQNDSGHLGHLSPHQMILDSTDWASLATPSGTGEALPAALKRILDTDPIARATAVSDVLRAVTHQNTIYPATVPVALCIAAVLDHPAITAGEFEDVAGMPPRRPTLVSLLDWLSDAAYDANDESLAISERPYGEGILHEDAEMRAFRDLRPAIFAPVYRLLGHGRADVHDAALIATIPLTEHPVLITYRGKLTDHAHRLLATSTDRRKRDRVLDALKVWGHDVRSLESAEDVAARELRVRRATGRASWAGGYSESPPF